MDSDVIKERLSQVQGYNEKKNDICVYGNLKNCSQIVVFFGGDVQDYPEEMEKHRDNNRYVEWNIETTVKKIHDRKFSQSLIFAIRPFIMYIKTFAVYSNFFGTCGFGNPVHSDDFGAFKHLHDLLKSSLNQICCKYETEIADSLPIVMVGFSRGCLVLNQFVHETHLQDVDSELKQFMSQIKRWFWLDGGHSGDASTYVTEDLALEFFAALKYQVYIHVTPYQIGDPKRQWIKKHEAKFLKKLKELKVDVHEFVHFEQEPRSIENHFKVLDEF